ncbi:MAG TPA: M1 family aminopeptidase [Thermoanaerobaculia bacterium]|nr:M1 family aminopeptidase [Thermoanaerobaculia bacterium]
MLTDIVRFEWRFHTRQISFLAAAALFFLFGFALTGSGFGPDNVNIDSPYSVAESIGLLSLASIFILAVFCANAVVRDRETQMEEIVFTTSVDKLPFLVGRFTGSFLAAFTAFSTSTLGMFVARFMPWQDADRIGAIDPLHYLWALLVVALPNMLFAAAVLFALSTVTRSVLASYAGSVLIYVLYFVSAAMTNSPLMASSVPGGNDGPSVAALLDPFALSAFFEQTRHWTPTLRNTKHIALTGTFLMNRVLWIAASLAIFAMVYRAFNFRVTSRSGATGSQPVDIEKDNRRAESPSLQIAEPVPSNWLAYLAATRMEIRTFLFTLPFLAMMLLWAGLAAFELINDVTGGEYGSASYPAAGMLFATLQRPLTLLATILLVYTSAEIVWRERSLKFSGILHATPASNFVFVASKCTALAALVGVVTATGLATAAVIQLTRGWPVNFGLILAFAWFIAIPLVLFACMAVVIQTLSAHKYLGMLIVLLAAIVGLLGTFLGSVHPLLRFGWVPDVVYSDMNGFGRTAGFHWLIVYWGAFTALLLIVATVSWRGGRRRITPGVRGAAATTALVFLATGAFIFYNTNVLNAWTTADDVLAWRAGFERKYKSFAVKAQPRVDALTAIIDLDPQERRFRVRGSYVLRNDTSRAIDEVLVAIRRDAAVGSITMPGARVIRDAEFNQHVLRLERPLRPGATTTVQYDLTYAKPGFAPDESSDPVIVDNGSYIMSYRAFPTIGYRASYEIQDPRERRRHGLPASGAAEASREFLPHDEIESADWVRFDVTISTAADQIAIAPGRLVRDWMGNGRRSFHYRSDALIPNQFAISSGRFAVARETHHAVAIEIYHHPEHTQNVARMMRAAAETLAYCTDNFGPYPHPHLRLVEVPAQFRNFSGFAQPGVIFFGENRGFLIDARDPKRLDLVYRRVAHEVAHQWWGHQLVAADAPGGTMLTESLTKYAELMLLAKAYGAEQVRQSLTYELDLYLAGRTSQVGGEPPLAQSENQSYLYYRKGALVMYALKDLLGEANVNRALRELLREQGGPHRSPTTAHLLAHLRAVAPPAQHALIDQWLNDVVLYDFKLASAQSQRLPNGHYEITMRIDAAKSAHDKTLPLRESIDVGIYAADETRLHLAKYPLHDGAQEIKVTVDREPLFAAVDPYISRIDRNRFDNTKRISGPANRPAQ